jgi:drug/metabolite transporter (DMT)-like permease
LTPKTKAQLTIHFCVVLWGFTAILGKLITLPALPLVFYRMLLVAVVLAFVPRVRRGIRALSSRMILACMGAGVLVSLHWLLFYGAVKLANASVGATCMALSPVFLAVVEPFIARRDFEARELVMGVAVVPGVALVVGGIPSGMRAGLLAGVASAFFVALFSAVNKRLVAHVDSMTMTALELGAGAILLGAVSFVAPHEGPAWPVPSLSDARYLVILAMVCTLLPFTLALHALRELSAFATQLAVNLEPVYSIVLAVLLLGEQRELGLAFYAGVAVILAVVVAYPFLTQRAARKDTQKATDKVTEKPAPEV